MSDKEAKRLLKLLRSSSEDAAIKVIKFIGVTYKTKNGRKKPQYKWEARKFKEFET